MSVAEAAGGQQTAGRFDLRDMEPMKLGGLGGWILDHPQWLFRLLRRFWPIVRIPKLGYLLVTRFDDVQEVLDNQQIFQVPYGERMKELNAGPNFVLGMPAGADYQRYHHAIMQAFRREDAGAIVAPMAARFSAEILARANGRLDAIQDYITAVPTRMCEEYFGIEIPEKVDFAHWTLAMATYIFADLSNNPGYARAAKAGAENMRGLVDAAIARAKAPASGSDTVVARLVKLQAEGELGDEDIRSLLIGMITGFIPTNTLAGGHILEMLLDRPDMLAATRAAAVAGDDDRLKRCLLEIMRFRPLNFGPIRVCGQDYVLAPGTFRETKIAAQTKVIPSTQSAMFDGSCVTNPGGFDPDRSPCDYSMVFGYGMHWCVGAFIAQAHLIEAFKSLVAKQGFRRAPGAAGEMQQLGPYPAHLEIELQA